jgi:signal transduction histidine kinase
MPITPSVLALIIQIPIGILIYKNRIREAGFAIYITVHSIGLLIAVYFGGVYSNTIIFLPVIFTLSIYLLPNKRTFFGLNLVILVVEVAILILAEKFDWYQHRFSEREYFDIMLFSFIIITSFMIYSNYKNQKMISNFIFDITKDRIVLKELFQEKRKLLSILFHDLSNSLFISLIKTNPSLLKNKDKGDVLKNVTTAHKSLQMMEELIGHVRELEAVNMNKKEIVLAKVNLTEVFDDLIFLFESRLMEKLISLNIHLADDAKYVLANKVSLLNSVLSNILSNAIKYSTSNSNIEINTKRINNEVIISIQDYGVGIPQVMLRKIFDFNEQTTRLGTNGEKGTGFGLPIVKSVLEGFGGSIDVESTEGSGTLFQIKLCFFDKKI